MKTMGKRPSLVKVTSVDDRPRRLSDLYRAYMRGEVDIEEFAASERQYRPDYVRVMRSLAKL